ncbi:MAG: alpha-2-macroglobulin, partial [Sphingobacteriales bacterium]
NRLWEANASVDVPWWYDKSLQLSFGTYRNHALPGSPEKWTVTVRGLQGDKVAAELLATMYDASLDKLKPSYWFTPDVWPYATTAGSWRGPDFKANKEGADNPGADNSNRKLLPGAPRLIFQQGMAGITGNIRLRGIRSLTQAFPQGEMNEVVVTTLGAARQSRELGYSTTKVRAVDLAQGLQGKVSGLTITTAPQDTVITENVQSQGPAPVVRRDFRETAFFYPDLRTDSNGTVSFEFNYPEAVTTWRLRTLALTKDLAFGTKETELITQKPLMVQPNLPRFLRQGDHFEIVSKVVNLTGKELTGQAQLELFDAATGTPVDGWFQNTFPNQYFTVAANGTESVAFPVEVPYLYNSALTWRITARADDFSDAEEATLPVLSSKVLVTETLHLPMRGNGTKTFSFDKLLRSGESETLQQQGLTLEFTANPAWTAVQSLPYLMQYPYECAEQTWNRYYANAVAAHILQRTPRIRAIFERWKTLDTAALQSALEKNPELKSALLEETPWVLDAENESRRKQNIALLFDLARLLSTQEGTLGKLKDLQKGDGSFPWFEEGPSDRYITTYILAGIGHLQELGIDITALAGIREKALKYADAQLGKDYAALKTPKASLSKISPNNLQALYLYARSFTRARPADSPKVAFDYYLACLEKTWPTASRRTQGMTALALQRYGNKSMPAAILRSLRETAIQSEELGMYWKNVRYGRSWYWYDAPIETQALLIEAFSEIAKDTTTVNELRTWLLKNKQASNWRTTTATADACYALLLRGSDWLSNTPRVVLQAGPLQVSSDTASEAGSGYFKKVIPGALLRPEM